MMKSFIVAASLLLMAAPVAAQDWRSAYTDLDFAQCTIISTYEIGADFACPGHRGYPVLVAESDLRMAVSYGFGARDERAFGQTFAPFNNTGPRIEWLLADHPERGEIPVGTILRFFIAAPDYEDPDRQVLVVTKIEPGNTCQVAHVDALANRDANQMARDAARRLIPGFDCARGEPERVGTWSLE
ncbi:hypothetical protein [Pelagibacterium limicola]|uniref:hypothetical protein n=1 Tax=Pelagibacterium limicola TaxID=2791022 RepID=UPI0018AF803E|nr:hypothetical protein [Pelagibacterium limicola]